MSSESQVFPHKIFCKQTSKQKKVIFTFSILLEGTFPLLKNKQTQSRKHPASGYFQCFQIFLSVWGIIFDVAENQTVQLFVFCFFQQFQQNTLKRFGFLCVLVGNILKFSNILEEEKSFSTQHSRLPAIVMLIFLLILPLSSI